MKLLEMTVEAGFARLLCARPPYPDADTRDAATEWFEFRVKSPGDDNRRLGVVQVELCVVWKR